MKGEVGNGRRRKLHHLQKPPYSSCSLGISSELCTASTWRQHSREGHGLKLPGIFGLLSPSQDSCHSDDAHSAPLCHCLLLERPAKQVSPLCKAVLHALCG